MNIQTPALHGDHIGEDAVTIILSYIYADGEVRFENLEVLWKVYPF